MAEYRRRRFRSPIVDSERDGEAMVGLYAPDAAAETAPSSDALQEHAGRIPNLELFYNLEHIFSRVTSEGKRHLSPAMGNAALLRDNTGESGRGQHWAQQVITSIAQYENQLTQMDWYRTEGMSRKRPVAWAAFLDEVIDEFASFNQRTIPIRIVNHVRGGSEFHADLLKRVLLHIIRNSYDAISDHGSIVVTSTVGELQGDDERKRLVVRIRDDGCGIAAAKVSEVWRPFFSTRCNHFGLGLSYVQMAVAVLDGTVDIESADGIGTTVTITFQVQGGNLEATQTINR